MPKTCTECSFETFDSAKFCANCGAKMGAIGTSSEVGRTNEIDRVLSITPLAKGFKEKYDGYNDFNTIEMRFQNIGDKDIKAFKADVEVFDLFEMRIIGLTLQIQSPLRRGTSKTDTILWEYNQFLDEHKRLRFTEWDYLVVKCKPTAVIFENGSKIVLQ